MSRPDQLPSEYRFPLPEPEPETQPYRAVMASSANSSAVSGPETQTCEVSAPSSSAGEATRSWPEIPGYVLVRCIGGGGMGVVYEAVNRLGRRFALKVIRPDRADDDLRARFRKEAAALLDLDHPHIARIFEYNEANGIPYFTMRLLTGGPLSARMTDYQGNAIKAVTLLAKIAEAVGFLHHRGMLHRDLKPANILFDEDGLPYVSDLGLVKELADAEADLLPTEARLSDKTVDSPGETSTGQVIGTPRYMSPEQRTGKVEKVTSRSDVWALGAILYELLTGRRPFDARDRKNGNPLSLRALNPALDLAIEKIVLTCLAEEPEQRYETANDLAAELRHWLAGPEKKRARRRLVVGLVSVGAVLALAALIAFPLYRHYTDPDRPLREAQHQLERGEAVEVISKVGKALYLKAHTGPEASIFDEKNGTLTVSTQKLALIELMPDPMRDRYRFKVNVRLNTTTSRAARTGIYCMHSAHEKDGNVHHSYVELSVRDDDDDEKAIWEFKKPGPNRAVTSIALMIRASGEKPIYNKNSPAGQDAFEADAVQGQPGPWHELELEVTLDGVSAKHKGKLIGQVKHDTVNRRMNSLLSGPAKLAMLPLASPRGGLGLYVLGSSASYRLGAIEPLP